jgi:hypothetical protein
MAALPCARNYGVCLALILTLLRRASRGPKDMYVEVAFLCIDVVGDDCLDMVFPWDEVLEHIKAEVYAPEPESCQDSEGGSKTVIIIATCVATVVIVASLFHCPFYSRTTQTAICGRRHW